MQLFNIFIHPYYIQNYYNLSPICRKFNIPLTVISQRNNIINHSYNVHLNSIRHGFEWDKHYPILYPSYYTCNTPIHLLPPSETSPGVFTAHKTQSFWYILVYWYILVRNNYRYKSVLKCIVYIISVYRPRVQ